MPRTARTDRVRRNALLPCCLHESAAVQSVQPKARGTTEKTDRNAMQRLLTAAAAALLVVTATVFNSLRYPSVSVQLWQASQAAHGPSTAPAGDAAVRSLSGGSRPFGLAENGGSNIAEQPPAVSPQGAPSQATSPLTTWPTTTSSQATTSPPASAAAATPDRAGDFAENSRAAGEAKPLSPDDDRFMPEAPGLPRAGKQAAAERAVWPSWRSDETVSPRTDSTPTPPQPFGMTPRPGVPAGRESRLSNVAPASAATPGVAMPRLSDERSPTARPADMVSVADPAPGVSPSPLMPATKHPPMMPVARPVPVANGAPTAEPSLQPASDRAAIWSPVAAGSAPSRRSTETSSSATAGSFLSAAIPPPAPIPDRHRPDLVPVAPAEPAGAATERVGGTGVSLPVRRLPTVDDGPTAPTRTKPPTAAELPAYPSTRTP